MTSTLTNNVTSFTEDDEKLYNYVSEEEVVIQRSSSEQEKSIIAELIKQLSPTGNLFSLSMPGFVMKPISLLEKLSSYAYPSHFIEKILQVDKPEQRMLRIVGWMLTNWHFVPSNTLQNSKPYNPVLGEVFQAEWHHDSDKSKTVYTAEQVSHKPPISAFHAVNMKRGFAYYGYVEPQVAFHWNSVCSEFVGKFSVDLMGRLDEKYRISLPHVYCTGLFVGNRAIEIWNQMAIVCDKTGYHAVLDFKANDFTGKVMKGKQKVYELHGKLSGKIFYRDLSGFRSSGNLTQSSNLPPSVSSGTSLATSNNDSKSSSNNSHAANINTNGNDSSLHVKTSTGNLKEGPGGSVGGNNTAGGSKEGNLLVDFTTIKKDPIQVEPLSKQKPNHSRRLWHSVTKELRAGRFLEATRCKIEIEEMQRRLTAERKKNNIEFVPHFFHWTGHSWELKKSVHKRVASSMSSLKVEYQLTDVEVEHLFERMKGITKVQNIEAELTDEEFERAKKEVILLMEQRETLPGDGEEMRENTRNLEKMGTILVERRRSRFGETVVLNNGYSNNKDTQNTISTSDSSSRIAFVNTSSKGISMTTMETSTSTSTITVSSPTTVTADDQIQQQVSL